MPFRITSWNVNGIRNPFSYQPWREKRSFQIMFDILEADIVVMQETKIQRKDLKDDMVLVPGWDVFFSLPKHKKGYSGVAIYTRNSTCCPIRAEEGITGQLSAPNSSTKFCDLPESQRIGGYPRPGQLPEDVDLAMLDSEGRCVILEFPAFVLIGTYSPATRDASRAEFRISYLQALDVRVRNLIACGKQVILTGDLNVVRSVIDTTNLTEQLRKEGMTIDEWMDMPGRRLFNQLIFEGNVLGDRDKGREEPVLWDLCRLFHPERQGMFTCWDTRKNTRPANNGSRIDYVLCSTGLKDWFSDSNIQEGLHGSDHCPVYGTFGDVVTYDGQQTHLRDLVNPNDMVRDGRRLRDWSQKDLLPMSARLIPEFDRRRNIRDMFMKKPMAKPPTPTTSTWTSSFADETRTGHDLPQNKEASQDGTTQHTPPSQSPSLSCVPPSQTKDPPTPTQNKDPSTVRDAGSSAKRSVEATNSLTRPPLKKSKTNEAETQKGNNASGLAQSSLRGFFKPSQPPSGLVAPSPALDPPLPRNLDAATEMTTVPDFRRTKNGDLDEGSSRGTETEGLELPGKVTSPPASTPSSISAIESAEKVFDPIHAKESWSKLQLGKRVVPKCEHGEPCISLLTKKPGVNCGRSFYICPRPLGPSGEKETGTQWRCGTFIWSSDWRERGGSSVAS